MKGVKWFFAGIGGLILIYLLATNADKVEKLISSLASAGIKGTAVLQGRDVVGVTR